MTDSATERLAQVYGARSDQERRSAYAAWANDYESDLANFGYLLPGVAAALAARHVAIGDGTILDAGCGTGLVGQLLSLVGFGPIVGVDLSEDMLAEAGKKGVYDELRMMRLGDELDFPDDGFAAILCVGTLTPGHAGPETIEELLRIVRPGGRIIFSLRADEGIDPGYGEIIEHLQFDGRWRHVESSPAFPGMPGKSVEILHRIHVYSK
ncbi:class I SAM-dependent DNA methyltransferase [Reyranella sp.]|uniref:class I SAM-dependent DNA methyltransferase n=1 Tax=Reyranella sp. TaxID=1929291 RepID=UPI003BAC85B8|tara:strand:+ start:132 stop:761 length:630 start_codon:yes stop_codon:yes gene_type:complete